MKLETLQALKNLVHYVEKEDEDRTLYASDIQKLRDFIFESEKQTEQYLCQSYFDDDDKLKNCTCGKCI